MTNSARQQGRYYTPRFLVEAMLRLALDPLLTSCETSPRSPLRILDPACGDGAFLLVIAERLRAWQADGGTGRDNQLLPQLFGVDIDQSALIALRSRVSHGTRIRWGDALTGRGFGEPEPSPAEPTEVTDCVPGLDWPTAFPEVAGAGGFDLVIGNPPYRRELASKELLDRLKRSPVGQRWHQPRLDLWAYFLHRGLDLLREGGRLAFVLPSYWTASTGAAQLIERLRTETTIRDVVQLGRARVFPQVEGWHLILSLVKGGPSQPCRIWDFTASGKRLPQHISQVKARRTSAEQEPTPGCPVVFSLEQSELFQHGQLCLSRPESAVQKMGEGSQHHLPVRFFVRQGIVENPRCITRNLLKIFPGDYELGEGVFALSPEEVHRLKLSPQERQLLKPYYRGTDIGRYFLSESPSEFLLYLTRETAPRLEDFPAIGAHLSRFRQVLENRREVQRGRMAWWHLHWPRQEQIFLAPRILMPQMGHAPRFVFCEKPAFVSFAMHLIGMSRPQEVRDSSTALLALAGVLNSELAARWFQRFAKHRGVALDISGSVLKRFPLPPDNPEAEHALAELVRHRQQLSRDSKAIPDREAQIESLVRNWYALSGG